MRVVRKTAWVGFAIVVALGVAGGSDAATVLNSCGNITTPGNYVVGQNLSTSTTCFKIQADNVAIDFQGHTLSGAGSPNYGISDNGTARVGIVISRGTITGFYTALHLLQSTMVNIDRMKLDSGSDDVLTGGQTSITNSKVKQMTIHGDSNNIINVTSDGSAGVAIQIYGSLNTLDKVKITNSAFGIFIQGGSNTLTNIKVNGSASIGAAIYAGSNTLSNLKLNDNDGGGIFIDGGSNSLNAITANSNGQLGIQLRGSANILVNVKANQNHSWGIKIDGSTNSLSNVKAIKNGVQGISIQSGANLLSNVTAKQNSSTGLAIGGADNRLTGITASGNSSSGVTLVCPSNVTRVTALGNAGSNLVETAGAAPCTNLGNNAP